LAKINAKKSSKGKGWALSGSTNIESSRYICIVSNCAFTCMGVADKKKQIRLIMIVLRIMISLPI
jgi:hypothetical protein